MFPSCHDLIIQVAYENRVEDLQRELMHLNQEKQVVEVEYSTLKKTVLSKEEEVKRRQSMMEVSEIIISQTFVIKLLSSTQTFN